MKILYYLPSLESVYAARFIYEGYKGAFTDLGHDFHTLTSKQCTNLEEIIEKANPDILIISLHAYSLKFLDLELIKKYRDQGLVLFAQIPPWKKQSQQMAGGNLENDKKLTKLIADGLAGDIFFSWLQKDDPVMEGFQDKTGYDFHTILLAADTHNYFPEYDKSYQADISYVGSYLSSKKQFIKTHLLPLKSKYYVKTYGSDWDVKSRFFGYIQKFGQYFNIESLKKVRKIQLPLSEERKVYTSSIISLNIHEDHQRKFGSDFNERTFKIIASGGFQICDHVSVIRRYFKEDELVIAEDTSDWFEKIDYFINNPQKRLPIIKKGREKVLREHTYKNRVEQIISIYNSFKNNI